MSGASMLFLLSFGAVLIQAISVSANVNANTNTNTNTNYNANAADRYHRIRPLVVPRRDYDFPDVNSIPDDSEEPLLAIPDMRRKLYEDKVLKPGSVPSLVASSALMATKPAIRDLCHAIAAAVRDAAAQVLGGRRRNGYIPYRRNQNSNVNSNVNSNTNKAAPEYPIASPKRPGGSVRTRPAWGSEEMFKVPAYYDPIEDDDDDEAEDKEPVLVLPEEQDEDKEEMPEEEESMPMEAVEVPVKEEPAPMAEEEAKKANVASKSMMARGWGHLKYPHHRGSNSNTNSNTNSNSNVNSYRRNFYGFDKRRIVGRINPRSLRRNAMRRNNLLSGYRGRYRRD